MTYAASRLRLLALLISLLAIVATNPALLAETPFTVPPGRVPSPQNIILGPDHNFWFTEFGGLKIGRMTHSGSLTEFSISGAQALCGIAAGPDGNIWFTDEYTGTIGHINVHGGSLVRYTLAGGHPQAIVTGPDGKLWFVDNSVNPQNPATGFRVGSITTAGQITEYLTRVNPGLFGPDLYYPAQIAVGPDNNLWFSNPQAASVGRNVLGKITTAGVITIYYLADTPDAITTGPDNNLWITEASNVAKVTTSGMETPYPITHGGSTGIGKGADGNLWFTETNTVGFVTPAGVITEFPPSNYSASFIYMTGLVADTSNTVWVLGSFPSVVGKVSASGQLTNTYALNFGSNIAGDTIGPDGGIWTTGWISDYLTRFDTQGNTHSFPTPAGARAVFITTGGDGNLWFTEPGRNSVAKMDTSGNLLGEYSVGQRAAGLWSIVKGPDGNVWFTEYSPRYNNIVRITPAGVMTPYTIPTPAAYPFYITNGPDGNLWFTELQGGNVGKIDPSTGQITEYPFNGTGYSLAAITTGPDNNLWIMETTTYGAIAKFSTSGQVLGEYPAQFETFLDIKSGPDGALWFTQFYPNSMGRITTDGVVSTVPLVVPNAVTNGLAIGSDHKIWFTESEAGALGRMSAIGGTGNTVQATHGSPFNGAVASFVDGTPTATSGNFTATINWGDGTQTSGTVTGSTGGPFTVSGTHTYAFPWNFKVIVMLHDTVDNSTYTASPSAAQVN